MIRGLCSDEIPEQGTGQRLGTPLFFDGRDVWLLLLPLQGASSGSAVPKGNKPRALKVTMFQKIEDLASFLPLLSKALL